MASPTLATGCLLISASFTVEIDPVKSLDFTSPYPTTTTVLRDSDANSKLTFKDVLPFVAISLVLYPIKEILKTAFSLGTVISNFPSKSVMEV